MSIIIGVRAGDDELFVRLNIGPSPRATWDGTGRSDPARQAQGGPWVGAILLRCHLTLVDGVGFECQIPQKAHKDQT